METTKLFVRFLAFHDRMIYYIERKSLNLQDYQDIIMQTDLIKTLETPLSLAQNIGIEMISIEDGLVKASMPVDERTSRPCEPKDILNGGASLALAETTAGYGSLKICSDEEMPVGIQISANHLSMATVGQTVYATGTLIHKGRTQHVWNVDITTEDGKLVSTARITNLIVKKRV